MDFRDGSAIEASGSSSSELFAVEARTISNFPFMLDDGFIVDNNWRRIHFAKHSNSKIGIPNPAGHFNPIADQQQLFGYETAEALRNMFIAHCNLTHHAVALETRLVKVQLVTTFKEIELGVTPPMSLHGSIKSLILQPRRPESEKKDPESQDQNTQSKDIPDPKGSTKKSPSKK